MDFSADSETLPNYTTVEGLVLEEGLSLPNTHCKTQSEGTILLHLLECKTHLLEVVEELHIRRDAETRFEDQLSKLVLDKQELEWEKESLQQQIETMTNQHKESLTNLKKQFQAKIRNTEEEKGKYQVIADLKDKEINNLKEELKSLQLLKYNLEKKSSELEQKLTLQSRSKESHLNQLGEVDKRFTALSRQCAMVKQAHEKLEQNVNEAIRINKKLSTANTKQEETIVSLMEELEDVSKKLIKAKVTTVRHDKTHTPTGKEENIQQLHQKLDMESEMNKRLREENYALRAEKKEVMKSLQHAQQLLLSQTQTVSRVELELQTQREQYQTLKQEHEVKLEKGKEEEDKVAQLMESYAASKTSWDRENIVFLDRIKIEQQDLQAVKEAYDELHQKHTELSSQAKVQGLQIREVEMRDSSQSLSVSTQFFPTLEEEVRAGEPLNEPTSSSELSSFGSQLASSQAKNGLNSLDCLEDTDIVTKLVVTGATGGQGPLNNDQQYQFQQPLKPTTLFTSPVVSNHLCSLGSHFGTDNSTNSLEKVRENMLNGNMKDSGSNGPKRRLMKETTDKTDRQGENKGSAEDGGDTRNHETETKDRAQGEGIDGLEERGKIALHTSETPETQILAQSSADITIEKSNTRQVIDFMDTEPPPAVSDPSDFSQNLSPKVIENDAHFCHENKRCEIGKEEQLLHTLNSDDGQSISQGLNPVIQEVQTLFYTDVQTENTEPLNKLPCQIDQVSEKNTELFHKSTADFLTKLPNVSMSCSSQTNAVPLATPEEGIVSIQVLETNTAQTSPSFLPDITVIGDQMDEMCDTRGSKECLLLKSLVESQSLPPHWKFSEQKTGQGKSLLTDDHDGNFSAYNKGEDQSNVHSQVKYSETVHDPVEKCNLKYACLDLTMDTVDIESEVKSGSCQDHIIEQIGDEQTNKSKVDLRLHSNECAAGGHSDCSEQNPAKQMLLDNTESFLPSKKRYKSSFDWSSGQRKTASSRTQSDVLILPQFIEGTEQNTSWSGKNHKHPPSTKPMFLKSKHNKVPLVISRASVLLNASSVSGTPASLRRPQQKEWEAVEETFRETIAADMESKASGSTSSSKVSSRPWQATSGCSGAYTSAAGHISESDWEPSCSQESEDQQSSLRAQISKIEQFLNAERLRLPKRQRTDN
ncbi:hypothetical protein Q8A73_004967 [Channa argus]|nr:hypothetical protein Q8A73_004967 [Channa argus]